MVRLEDVMKVACYNVCEGSDFLPSCYGVGLKLFEFAAVDEDEEAVSCIFDPKTQIVHEITFIAGDVPVKWVSPEFRVKNSESKTKDGSRDFAWEGVPWTDMQDLQEILGLINDYYKGYENEQLLISVTPEIELALFKLAHRKDMTVNQVVEDILTKELGKKVNN